MAKPKNDGISIEKNGELDRRSFLRKSLVAGGAIAAASAGASQAFAEVNPANLPPNKPIWSQMLGPGVTEKYAGDFTPRGPCRTPKCRLANIFDTVFDQLHTTAGSARHHHS